MISLDKLSLAEKIQMYCFHTRPVVNMRALFADGSPNYIQPAEPCPGDRMTFRFRAGKDNVDAVYLCIEDWEIPMKLCEGTEVFDYYEAVWTAGNDSVHYHFTIWAGDQKVCYNRKGASGTRDQEYDFQLTPGFSTPSWAKGAVMYQIYVDRFANGDLSNDVLDREYIYIDEPVRKIWDWYSYPDPMDVRNFYGGDLQGVLDHLDYLKDLGVDAIYLNPIFVSPSNHKYDIQDYDYIDPHFAKIVKDEGSVLPDWDRNNAAAWKYISRVTDKENLEASNAFFAHFTEEVHKRGMKIILDGVFNHCGSFNKWMDAERLYENQPGYAKGAYISKESPFHHFFKFYNENAWPYNGDYDGWWGHKTLPKLNYEESDKLMDYILEIGRKWVSPPYNVDGWRLDVAADLGQSEEFNHSFWKKFRKAVKEANPEAIILAEHYGDPSSWLQGDEWDTVMNYNAFMEPVTWFLTGMEKHSDEKRPDLKGNNQAFRDAMVYHMSRFQYPSLEIAMNELSNHDHSRFLTRTNMTVGRSGTVGPEAADRNVHKEIMRAGVMMQMTWPGAPTVYYGDEAGLTGWTDPDNRRTYPWQREDQEMISYHRDMIRIHKESEALMHGSIKLLNSQDGLAIYGRFTDKEKMVVIISGEEDDRKVRLPVWEIGVTNEEYMETLMVSDRFGYSRTSQTYEVEHGFISFMMPGNGAVLLRAVRASSDVKKI